MDSPRGKADKLSSSHAGFSRITCERLYCRLLHQSIGPRRFHLGFTSSHRAKRLRFYRKLQHILAFLSFCQPAVCANHEKIRTFFAIGCVYQYPISFGHVFSPWPPSNGGFLRKTRYFHITETSETTVAAYIWIGDSMPGACAFAFHSWRSLFRRECLE